MARLRWSGNLFAQQQADEAYRNAPDRKKPRTATKPASCGSWDCSSMFDPNSEWPDEQPWDGFSAPWMDQIGCDPLSAEFREIVG